MPTINELSQAAYQNSKAHGFWDGPRNKGEMIALMHSELSECLEGVRKDLMDDHLPAFTQEAAEMADTAIRIFDFLGGFGLRFQDDRTPISLFLINCRQWIYFENKGEAIADIHCSLSQAYACRESESGDSVGLLREALLGVFAYSAKFGIDLEAAISAKMAYNASRPYKHGKKF
jgi:NTP pyrophosphatase (non-canonical NTP hydrolase)